MGRAPRAAGPLSALALPRLPLDQRLSKALARLVAGADPEAAARLQEAYRFGGTPARPILADAAAVDAYAAYRMPATCAAVAAALRQLRAALGGEQLPRTLLDLGAGSGAASWAADAVFELEAVALIEQSADAIALGRRLAELSGSEPLAGGRWTRGRLGAADLPAAELAVCAYVLGELMPREREALVERMIAAAEIVLVVEAGTTAGYERVLVARRQLIDAGYTLLAPCPQAQECPLAGTGDWCHFAARVPRSPLHRRLKEATLGYEDEKFSYVAAVRAATAATPGDRVLARPQRRSGMVTLRLCRVDGTAGEQIVSRRNRAAYDAARDAAWGDTVSGGSGGGDGPA
jgi:ribosomal protein RSM22 (predicted rRNA methylase)